MLRCACGSRRRAHALPLHTARRSHAAKRMPSTIRERRDGLGEVLAYFVGLDLHGFPFAPHPVTLCLAHEAAGCGIGCLYE